MKILGIDLGTANTYIYAAGKTPEPVITSRDAPEPVILPGVSDAGGSISTVVLYENGAPALIGNIAESEFHAAADKGGDRRLASQFKPEAAQGQPGAMTAMTDFLRMLRVSLPPGTLAEDTSVYVGMPSLAREDFSINLGACFERAGWPRPSFVRESDAALISCLQSGALDIDDVERKCLILDFGGGTCDYTTVEGMDALQNGGDVLYGGRLFDDLFFQVFCRQDQDFAREAPGSPFEWYLHWIECKAQKEKFSDYAASRKAAPAGARVLAAAESGAGFSLHAVWHDLSGRRRDAFVPEYGIQEFVSDAENYAASPQMLKMLANYTDRGGLSQEARDLLQGRKVGLISWLRAILSAIQKRREVARIVLTGGSSRWFFVSELAERLFPGAVCAASARGYEDIAFGLALFPLLSASHERTKILLDSKLDGFCAHAVKTVRGLAQKQAHEIASLCAGRIITRDVLPVLEAARKKAMTAAEVERLFAENIKNDAGLLAIVEERSKALGAEIQRELKFSFSRWLKGNGVILAPKFEFPARIISQDFLEGLSVKISRLDYLKMAGFILTNILPVFAGVAIGGIMAHTGEPVSTLLGGGLAFGSTWLAAKTAPGILKRIKLPSFALNEAVRDKIVNSNKVEIEKTLRETFEDAQAELAVEVERRLKASLVSMLARLTVLNQIETR